MSGRPKHIFHGIKEGRIGNWPEEGETAESIASKVSYKGNPVHKTYKSLGQPGNWRQSQDKAKCDHFSDEQIVLVENALKQAISGGYVSEDFAGGFPRRAWAWVNDVLHEARLTNEGSGEYHGFPVELEIQYPEPKDRLRNAPNVTIPTYKRSN